MDYMDRSNFLVYASVSVFVTAILGWLYLPLMLIFLFLIPLLALGLWDMFQAKDAILRNFPITGRLRYLALELRPMVQQYFVESDLSGRPLNKLERAVVQNRAAKQRDTAAFGTQRDVYAVGYEWINHSICPVEVPEAQFRIPIGGPQCSQPYSSSILNISAMSYGSLSKNAIHALNAGAKRGGFFHNTGEGGLASHHLEPGGDLCWQIGTGYFGCRAEDGSFDPERYRDRSRQPSVKLIELKLSQGAKPGKGGILPAAKITPEISRIRNVPQGADVLSPASHRAFSTPIELLTFLQQLRELSGGKPVGFKLCVGKRREFLAICMAMKETGILPDFIAVDGSEGGTGAAPLEFSNSVGTPLIEGLIFVHNALVGFDVRKDIRVIASGKVTTGFNLAQRLAIGADICNAARAFMLSLGCIQALKCNTNHCPTGVATQDPMLVAGLDPTEKASRVYHFHKSTVKTFNAILGAAGLSHPDQLRPWHIMRRTNQYEIHHYGEIFQYLEPGSLLEAPYPKTFARALGAASAATFHHVYPSQ